MLRNKTKSKWNRLKYSTIDITFSLVSKNKLVLFTYIPLPKLFSLPITLAGIDLESQAHFLREMHGTGYSDHLFHRHSFPFTPLSCHGYGGWGSIPIPELLRRSGMSWVWVISEYFSTQEKTRKTGSGW